MLKAAQYLQSCHLETLDQATYLVEQANIQDSFTVKTRVKLIGTTQTRQLIFSAEMEVY